MQPPLFTGPAVGQRTRPCEAVGGSAKLASGPVANQETRVKLQESQPTLENQSPQALANELPAVQGRHSEGGQSEADHIADWSEPLKACLRRIRRWQAPANWSVPEWFDEMHSVATVAAIEAEGVFDPARGTPFDAFVRSRVLARALTFYRQEWAYATRYIDGVSLPEDQERLRANQLLFASEPSSHPACECLREALTLLPEQGLWLLEELYVHERTEADIGRQLGLTQRAINRRKHAALGRLRHFVERH